MGLSFRMDGWQGNSGFLPDGEDAGGTGRASLGGEVSSPTARAPSEQDELRFGAQGRLKSSHTPAPHHANS